MTEAQIIQKTKTFVKQKFIHETTGHDWWHMYRVWKLAKRIAVTESGANTYIVELGALLHDIADWKFHDGDIEAGPKAASEWLTHLHVDDSTIRHIEEIIRNVSFRGAGVSQKMHSLEGRIVSDADKLDALGAIGIARAFSYGGSHNRPLFVPNVKPTLHQTFEAYKNDQSHTINHFYEKLLLLKDNLYTTTARQLAEHRHQFLLTYLDEFYREWEGKI